MGLIRNQVQRWRMRFTNNIGGLYECCEFGNTRPEVLAMQIIANEQHNGGVVVVVDVDNRFDAKTAVTNGVILDDLLVTQPSSGKEAVSICNRLSNSNVITLIVVDSLISMLGQDLRGLSKQLRRSKARCLIIRPRSSSFPRGVKVKRIVV